MVAVHILAVVSLQPQYWSWGAVGVLLTLYWVTACLGGYTGVSCSIIKKTWIGEGYMGS